MFNLGWLGFFIVFIVGYLADCLDANNCQCHCNQYIGKCWSLSEYCNVIDECHWNNYQECQSQVFQWVFNCWIVPFIQCKFKEFHEEYDVTSAATNLHDYYEHFAEILHPIPQCQCNQLTIIQLLILRSVLISQNHQIHLLVVNKETDKNEYKCGEYIATLIETEW